jgi:hypothetical protein
MRALAAMASLAALIALAGSARAQTWSRLASGIDVAKWDAAGCCRAEAARVRLCQSGVRLRATTSGERAQRTSSWASSIGAAVAVNGGFYLSGYRPQGLAVGEGAQWPDSDVPGHFETGWVAFGRRHRIEFADSGNTRDYEPWMNGALVASHFVLRGGANVAPAVDAWVTAARPRTLFGLSEDAKTVYLLVAEGASVAAAADVLRSLGATDGVNLDGGGSSTFWTSTQGVLNSPSDGSERVVANHIGVFSTGSGEAYNCPEGRAFQLVSVPGSKSLTVTGEASTLVQSGARLKNTGTVPWNDKTRLAPLPREKASPYANPSWLSPTRIAAVGGVVAPGASTDVTFGWQLPDKPGTYKVPVTMLEEGAGWFADELGPADGAVTVTLEVKPKPPLRARVVRLSPNGRVVVAPGEAVEARVELENTGGQTWADGQVWLAPTQARNRKSPFRDGTWWSDDVAAQVRALPSSDAGVGDSGASDASASDASVPDSGASDASADAGASAATHAAVIILRAPASPGVYRESFGLVTANGTWFAEVSEPADDVIAFDIEVRAKDEAGLGCRVPAGEPRSRAGGGLAAALALTSLFVARRRAG